MSEKETIEFLKQELDINKWWIELIGQPIGSDLDIDKAVESIPYTEIVASQAVAKKFEHHVGYIARKDMWYAWNGIIHEPCEGHGISIKISKFVWEAITKALEYIQEQIEIRAQAIIQAGGPTADDDAKKMRESYEKRFGKHRQFRDRLATDAGVSALSRMMRTDCDLDAEHFDNDQRWFVMRNWVLDLDALREGKWVLLKHHPSRNVTKYFDADYPSDPKTANLGHWDSFLKRSIIDPDQRSYVQTVVGAGFMGTSKLRCIINLQGPPGGGKSVFIGTFDALGGQGAKYVSTPDSKSVTLVNGQNFEQDEYRGIRFVGISEPPHTAKIDDDFIKAYTGDTKVSTRTLNVKSSSWVPQGVLYIASNAALKINTRDKAIVERVQQVSFPVEFESGPGIPDERRKIRGIEDLILRDRSRVLMWIIAGMRQFVNDGMELHPPQSVLVNRDKVVVEGSTALQWVEEMVDEGFVAIDFEAPKSHCLQVTEAYMQYQLWCNAAGEKRPLTRKFFSKDIQNKYGEVVKSAGARFPGVAKTLEWERKFDQAWMTTN